MLAAVLHFDSSYLDSIKEITAGKDIGVVDFFDEAVVYIAYTKRVEELNDNSSNNEEFCKALGFDPEKLLCIEIN